MDPLTSLQGYESESDAGDDDLVFLQQQHDNDAMTLMKAEELVKKARRAARDSRSTYLNAMYTKKLKETSGKVTKKETQKLPPMFMNCGRRITKKIGKEQKKCTDEDLRRKAAAFATMKPNWKPFLCVLAEIVQGSISKVIDRDALDVCMDCTGLKSWVLGSNLVPMGLLNKTGCMQYTLTPLGRDKAIELIKTV